MQPTYLPWAGYFNLIAQVERFVFLDDVQYERRSWQSRNRILLHGAEHVLTVPVRRAERDAPLAQVMIDADQDWRSRHLKSLRHAYSKTESGREIIQLIESVLKGDQRYLVELNVGLISAIGEYLGLKTALYRASALGCGGKRSEHLARICLELKCSDYVSPAGARGYLAEDKFEERMNLGLQFQNYTPRPYPQNGAAKFVSHLSIVDVIANAGREFARLYVLDGSNACELQKAPAC